MIDFIRLLLISFSCSLLPKVLLYADGKVIDIENYSYAIESGINIDTLYESDRSTFNLFLPTYDLRLMMIGDYWFPINDEPVNVDTDYRRCGSFMAFLE